MPDPRVTVIVPTYNSAWSIERTLASIRAQTFRDFEVLVVDDGSTDDLHDRIAATLAADSRIRMVVQDNRGLAGARNRGVAEARGSLVAPIDADDVWEPDFLMMLVSALDEEPTAPFAYAYSYRMDENDRRLPQPVLRRPPRHDQAGLLALNSVGNGSAAVYRRDAVLAAGGYDETLARRAAPGAEDWKLILALSAAAPPVLIDRMLVGYRLVASSMSRADPRRQMVAVLQVIEDARGLYPKLPARAFADGRTMMVAWLLPVYVKRRLWREAARQAVRGYVMNPLWFANPWVRDVHLSWFRMKLRIVAGSLFGRRANRSRAQGAHPA